jgi:hypothetical protein
MYVDGLAFTTFPATDPRPTAGIWEGHAVLRNFPSAPKPDLFRLLVFKAIFESLSKRALR